MDLVYDLVNSANIGNIKRVQNLLDSGVDINAQIYNGDTALIVASKLNHIDVVQLLLDRGADPNIENKLGQTASTLALMNEHYDCVILLEKYIKENEISDELPDELPDEPDRDLQKYESARSIQRRFRGNKIRRQIKKNRPRYGKMHGPATRKETMRRWIDLSKQFDEDDEIRGYLDPFSKKGGKKKRKKTIKKRRKTKKKKSKKKSKKKTKKKK